MKQLAIGCLTLTLIVTSAALGADKRSQTAPDLSDAQINIRMHDYVQADRLSLRHAEQVAGEILEKAGVQPRWIDCSTGVSHADTCSEPVSTLDFVVNLLPESMSDRLHQPAGVLGYALEGNGRNFGVVASVFYDVAKDRAMDNQVDFGELLGDAIAHELGHLLLGTNSHSGMSLMSGFWSGNLLRLASQRGLSFSGAEVKKIQASMNARTLATEFTRQQQSRLSRNSSE